MVTSRLQSVSRWECTGLPCTPILATCPPVAQATRPTRTLREVPPLRSRHGHPDRPSTSSTPRRDRRGCVVDRDVGPKLLRNRQSSVVEIDGHNQLRTRGVRRRNCGETNGACANHHHDVPWSYRTVEHTNLEARRQDVRNHQHLFVAHSVRNLVGRGVREGNSQVFCLGPIDRVTKYPTSASHALAKSGTPREHRRRRKS